MKYWWGDKIFRVNLWNKNLKDESGENDPILKRCWLTVEFKDFCVSSSDVNISETKGL